MDTDDIRIINEEIIYQELEEHPSRNRYDSIPSLYNLLRKLWNKKYVPTYPLIRNDGTTPGIYQVGSTRGNLPCYSTSISYNSEKKSKPKYHYQIFLPLIENITQELAIAILSQVVSALKNFQETNKPLEMEMDINEIKCKLVKVDHEKPYFIFIDIIPIVVPTHIPDYSI